MRNQPTIHDAVQVGEVFDLNGLERHQQRFRHASVTAKFRLVCHEFALAKDGGFPSRTWR